MTAIDSRIPAAPRPACEWLEPRRLLAAQPVGSMLAPEDAHVSTFAQVGERGYFFAGGWSTGWSELWETDGTPAGTVPAGVSLPTQPVGLTAVNGVLVFVARDPDRGIELWRSDATQAGTYELTRFAASLPELRDFTVAGGQMFFNVSSDDGAPALRRTDGTPGGTYRLKRFEPGSPNETGATWLAAVGDRVFFQGGDAATGAGRELWVSDGTP